MMTFRRSTLETLHFILNDECREHRHEHWHLNKTLYDTKAVQSKEGARGDRPKKVVDVLNIHCIVVLNEHKSDQTGIYIMIRKQQEYDDVVSSMAHSRIFKLRTNLIAIV